MCVDVSDLCTIYKSIYREIPVELVFERCGFFALFLIYIDEL